METIDPTGTVLSSFGSSRVKGAGAHTGSGSQFYYPAQAAQGPDGTIYTADPLNTIEATSPRGYLEGSTTLGQNSNGGFVLAMGGYNFYLVGSTFFYQGGPPFNTGADNISTISLRPPSPPILDAAHVPTDSLGWGAGLSSSATANYFAAGTTPQVARQLRPVVAVRGLPPPAVLLDREHHLARRRDRAVTHHRSRSPPPPPGWPTSL